MRAFLIASTAAVFLAQLIYGQSSAALEREFRQPPVSTRPQTYWLWMNGNVSRQGITRDLEAMKRVGIGGVMIFDGGTYLPKGPYGYMSPEWRALMKHAIEEGSRLGIDIGMHNAPGWSSSGGAWITPERSMQQLVWTETTASGPGAREIALPQPRENQGYYRDAFVLAFPAAPGEEKPYEELIQNVIRARDSITFEFTSPFEARSITVQAAFDGRLPSVTLESSQDGVAWQRVAGVANPGRHGIQPPAARNFPAVQARFFRVTGSGAGDLAEVRLHHTARIEDWNFKANFAYRVGRQMEMPAPAADDVAIDPHSVRDLTGQIDGAGHLKWDVPAGSWTILRLGHTTTGQLNVSASEAGRGLECDKLSREAADFNFQNTVAKVLTDAGPLAGKSFGTVAIDSYEAGLQNWTAAFPEEFRKREGYDLRGYLPAMTGRIVGDRAISERFLFDVRRAQADMMAEYYYGRMGELCRQHGLKFYVEGYGQGVFDELQVSGLPEYPMTEFWERTPWTPNRTGAHAVDAEPHGKDGIVRGACVRQGGGGGRVLHRGRGDRALAGVSVLSEDPGRRDVRSGPQPDGVPPLRAPAASYRGTRHDHGAMGYVHGPHQYVVRRECRLAGLPGALPVSAAAGDIRGGHPVFHGGTAAGD
ncbi:conserved exported hypothetical protein [Candidatus Sulfopaludibacter sp. SbA3]|nr:conserved exported hypothetical protein [Candidatus Sulfopaludibacter sp. SbA3]